MAGRWAGLVNCEPETVSRKMPLKLLRPSLKSVTQLLSLVLALPALAACGLLNSELTEPSHRGDTPWVYWGPGAPNNWGSLSEDFTLCATGVRQSPIDLTGYNKDHAAPELAFNYSQDAREVTHNGKVAHVEYGESNSLKVENLTYQLAAVHIHVHAEHQIDGQLFPAEMHLVHRQQDGALGVVGQIYQLGNPDLVVQALIDAYPNPGETLQAGLHPERCRLCAGRPGLLPIRGFPDHPTLFRAGGLDSAAGNKDHIPGAGQSAGCAAQRL